MAQHGGKRPGAGRRHGVPNRATAAEKRTLSDMAKDLAPEALEALARVMRDTEQSGAAIVAAANAILDRAYGKPVAVVPDDGDESPALIFNIGVRPSVGEVRVTKPE